MIYINFEPFVGKHVHARYASRITIIHRDSREYFEYLLKIYCKTLYLSLSLSPEIKTQDQDIVFNRYCFPN